VIEVNWKVKMSLFLSAVFVKEKKYAVRMCVAQGVELRDERKSRVKKVAKRTYKQAGRGREARKNGENVISVNSQM
jgi:tmRNA-binding protein